MNIPKWLKLIVFTVFILSLIGIVFDLFTDYEILGSIADLALIMSLLVLIIYAYYTYLLSKDAWTPSASIQLESDNQNPPHIRVSIQNHSKLSLNCWCNLKVTVFGEQIFLGGFYDGKSSFDLQPFGSGTGHFRIKKILKDADKSIDEMKKNATPENIKNQLNFELHFWYNPVGEKIKKENPILRYYFDFSSNRLIIDI